MSPARWKNSSIFESLGDIPAGLRQGLVSGIPADGNTVTDTSSSLLGVQAFRWTQEDRMTAMGLLSGGNNSSFGRGYQVMET